MISINTPKIEPKCVFIKDDAAHEPKIFGNLETWYYDAIFDNNHSVVCLINVLNFFKKGIVLTGLFFYEDNKLINSIRNRFALKNTILSKEKPQIVINNKEIINSEFSNKNNEFKYHICMGDTKNNVDLFFSKKMEPWKKDHFLGSWFVVPKLDVKGNIFINDKKILVNGHGYHDHNIYHIYSPLLSKGANFGKIEAGPFNIVWAQVIKNKNESENILVINKDNEIISIPSDDIEISVINTVKEHGRKVPIKYLLNVKKNNIYINAEIESINYHFLTVPFIKYWRHHAKNTGEIQIDSINQKIDDIEIIDQLSFF